MKKQNKSIIIISIFLLIIVILTIFMINGFSNNDDLHRQTYEIDDENDDGRSFTVELGDIGYGNEYSSWALLQLSPSYSFGLKFDNISIEKNSTILNAYVELFSVGTPEHRTPNCKIYCDNVDDAINFSEMGVLDICGRNYTNNYSLWNESVPYNKWVRSPSIVELIQEIINRENWSCDNSIAILFISEGLKDYSSAFNNYDTGYPPRLYIEWKSID